MIIKLKNILTEKKEIAPKSIQGIGVLTQRNQHNVARAMVAKGMLNNKKLYDAYMKIDDLVDPRMMTVSNILKHVHKGTIENAYTILNGEYEVIEADIIETSELINKKLKDSNLPDEIRIGAILRGEEIITPSSNYVFQKEDTVVLLSKRDQLPTVENMFRISSI